MSNHSKSLFKKSFKAIGTDVSLDVVMKSEEERTKIQEIFNEVKKIINRYELIFSRFNPQSELCLQNGRLNEWQKASPYMIEIAQKALIYYRKSNRLYDPRIKKLLENIGYKKNFKDINFEKLKSPELFSFSYSSLGTDLKIKGNMIFFKAEMDFSGIVKGYIADQITKYLFLKGLQNFVIDLGGDMFAAGNNEQSKKWGIAIEGIPESELLILLSNSSIATSGASRHHWKIKGKKFHHLIDTKDPTSFSFDPNSVSVISDTVERADFLAKIIFLMGEKKGKLYSNKHKLKSFILNREGVVWISEEGKKNVV